MDRCLNNKQCTEETFYDRETDSYFKLLQLEGSSLAWNITCNGPIKMPIDIKVGSKLYLWDFFLNSIKLMQVDEEADVRISYYTPVERDPNDLEKYHWTHEPWTECSMACGGGKLRLFESFVLLFVQGIQEKRAICERIEDQQEVSPGLCDPERRKDDISQSCNAAPCPPEYVFS